MACRVWLITYGASGGKITHEICGELEIDQCYTVTGRDVKYTLLHTAQRHRLSAVTDFLVKLKEPYGIIPTNIFGYESVQSNTSQSKMIDHPGLKLIIEKMNADDPSFEYWMASGDLRTYKRGVLHTFITCIDTALMTRAQLVNKISNYEQQLRQLKSDFDELQCKNMALDSAVTDLGITNEQQKLRIKDLQRRLEYYREREDDEDDSSS